MKNRWTGVTVTNRYDPRGELAERLSGGELDAKIAAVILRHKAKLEAVMKKPDPTP